jgi:deoxyribodipyrimidine photo-lyase
VDAAMRQLNASGWMHSCYRMVVASYLVKDLICDRRWGESAFMARLVDGDLVVGLPDLMQWSQGSTGVRVQAAMSFCLYLIRLRPPTVQRRR